MTTFPLTLIETAPPCLQALFLLKRQFARVTLTEFIKLTAPPFDVASVLVMSMNLHWSYTRLNDEPSFFSKKVTIPPQFVLELVVNWLKVLRLIVNRSLLWMIV